MHCNELVSSPPRTPSRRVLLGAALGLVALAGTACARRSPLVLAGHPWPGYEPLFLARSLGYLPENLALMDTPTVDASIEAVRSGQADGAMLTLDEVLRLRDQGTALQIVLVFDVSKGADMVLVRPALSSLRALRGRRIGAEPSALGALMLALVLEKAGLQRDQVELRQIPYEAQEAAWAEGTVDALITYEPAATRLKKNGARTLLSTRDLPDTIFDVLAVRPKALATHADTLRATLAGHFRALSYLRQNPWDAAYQTLPRLGVSAEDMIASLRGLELPDLIGNQRYLSDQDGDLLRVAHKLSPLMQEAGVIRQPAETQGLYSNAYLPPQAT